MDTTYLSPQLPFRTCSISWFRSSRLLGFFVVSLSLHGLLIAMAPGIEQSIATGQQVMQQPVYLTLNAVASNNRVQHKPLSMHHPTTAIQASRHVLPTPSHPVRNKRIQLTQAKTQTHLPIPAKAKSPSPYGTQARNRPITQQTAATSAPSQRVSILKPSPNPTAVAALLRRALQQHFHYPVIALQNNWEGKVILGVRVTPGGKVSAAQVLKASGFAILDRAAQHAVNDIGRLPAAPPLLAGQTLSFRVPVAYRIRR